MVLKENIFQALDYGICVIDEEGKILESNKAWEIFIKENNILPQTNYFLLCSDLIGPGTETAKSICRGIQEVIAGDRDYFEIEHTNYPFSDKCYLASVTLYAPLENLSKRKVIISHKEITQIKRKEINKGQNKYEQIIADLFLNNSTELITFQDTDLNILWANQAAENAFGKLSEEIIGKKCYEIVRKSNTPCPDCPVIEAIETGKPCYKEKETYEGRFWEVTGLPVKDENENVIGVVEIALEITEKKQLEFGLEERNKLLEAIVNSISDGLMVQNPDFTVDYSNPAVYNITRQNKDESLNCEISGLKCYEILGYDEECEEECTTKKAIKKEEPIEVEKYHPSLDLILESRAHPIFDEEGNITKIIKQWRDVTEKRRTELLLKESEEKFRSYINEAPVGIFILDPEGYHIEANPEGRRLRGCSLEELKKYRVFDFVHPDYENEAKKNFKKLAEKGRVQVNLLTKQMDGSDIWLKIIAVKLNDGRLIAFASDITELKHTEEKLRESRELFDKVLEATNDGIWDWNVKTGEAYFSKNYYTMLGYEPGEFEANYENWQKLLRPEDLKTAEEGIRKSFAGKKEGLDIEFRAKTKEGGYKWILARGKVVERDHWDNPIRVVGKHADIDERKKREEFIRSIINAAKTVSLIVTDLNSIVKEFSPGAEIIFGYKREEIIGNHTGILHTSSDKQRFPEYIEKLKHDKDGFTFETQLIRKSGEVFPTRFTLQPIFDNEGELSGTLGVSIDISELKAKEEEILQSQRLLEGTLNAVPDVIGIQFPDHTIERYNKAGYEMFNMSYEELKGKKCYELIGRETECENCVTRKVLNSKTLETTEKYSPELDLYLHSRANPILNSQGEIEYIVEQIQDVTDYKRTLNVIKESEEKFRTLFEKNMLGIILHYFDGNIVDVNPEASKQLGYSRKELLEMSIFDIMYTEEYGGYLTKQDVLDLFNQMELGDREIVEDMHQRKDGSLIYVEVSTGPVRYNNQNIIIALVQDITYRKQAEKKLQKNYKELEQKNLKINNLYDQLRQEVEKVRIVHERLLPSNIHRIEKQSIEPYCRPAEKIGGDFYNIIQKGEKLVFYISDVTGHGLDGAIFNTFIKESIDSYLELRPEEIQTDKIIKHLYNQYKSEDYPDDSFISIFLGVLDLDSYELSYIGMGFPESVLVSFENGEDLKLHVEGLPITKTVPMDYMNFEVKSISLNSGTTLMVYSDGLVEQENSKGEFFHEGLYDAFFSNSDLPAEALKRLINERFRRFNDGKLQADDDITFLIIKLDEDSPDFSITLNSNFEELEKVDSEVFNYLKKYSVEKIYFQGIYELVMNSIEHGNKFDENKKVTVSFKDLKDRHVVTVEDEGNGFNWIHFLDNKCLDLEGEEERGRGIIMTQTICDALYYNEKGNKAFLVLNKA